MISFDTFRRAICTVALVLGLVRVASAQSELNFVRSVQNDAAGTGIVITNTSPYFADVQLTFYNPDGTIVSNGLINPVSSRIPPRGQLSRLSGEIFGTSRTEGWIQATSPTSGLHGAYFSGDFRTKFEGSEATSPLTTQIIPYLRQDSLTETTIFLTNPGLQNASATISFYNERGDAAGSSGPIALAPRGQVPVRVAAGQSARVLANVPILATAVLETKESLLFITGQSVDPSRSARVIPHFISGGANDSILVLANPTSDTAAVTITLFSETGGAVIPFQSGPASLTLTIPPHGVVTRDASQITQFPFAPPVNGWVRVDSPDVALDGLAILSSGSGTTVVPLQTADMTRVIFSQASENQSFQTQLVLVHAGDGSAAVNVTLSGSDGKTVVQRDVVVGSNAKMLLRIRDLLPSGTSALDSGFVTIRSSSSIYSVEMLSAAAGTFMAAVTPQRLESGFVPPPPVVETLALNAVEVFSGARPGSAFQITVANAGPDLVAIIGGQVVIPRANPFSRISFFVDIPAQLDPGFVNFNVRSGGVDSSPVTLHILDRNDVLTQTLGGEAFYQKVEVTDAGLETSRTSMVPIRNARVEVLLRSTQSVVSVSQTDDRGQFQVALPLEPVIVRVASRLRALDLLVEDNTNSNGLYYISADVDMRDPPSHLLLADTTRTSGAFNILEMVQRGNDLIGLADSGISPPPVTIFWSVRNTSKTGNVRDGNIGGTYFNFSNNTAFILGDRATDSDEFDDSVIIHEYAHMLAARFSRDDSPGGIHGLGDMLDPRLAWSEGWANFFSSAARNNPIYRDSRGLNGANVLRYDLEENVPIGDRPGYWSEASVESLLWDLIDEAADSGDAVQVPFSSVWAAITDMKNDRFVYLPYFLDHFVERNPLLGDSLRAMVQLRAIDFQPNVRPSVTNPFPRPIAMGENVTGEVDSLTLRRSDLIQSSHFFSFTTGGGAASIRMEIQGLGPGNNSSSNDLDLFLMDGNGRALDKSDRGLNGQSELISIRLPAGTYVVEVRSFYKRLETNEMIFNSGRYRLNVLVQ